MGRQHKAKRDRNTSTDLVWKGVRDRKMGERRGRERKWTSGSRQGCGGKK